jgi:hypothetical protein
MYEVVHPWVFAGMREPVLLGCNKGPPLLKMRLGRSELSQTAQGIPQETVGRAEAHWVTRALSYVEELFPQGMSHANISPQ